MPSQAQGQVTPVVRSSLQALRESRPQSGGGTTSAAASAVSAAPDAARTDEERSITERLMEAGAQALKQERLAKKKLQALQKSRVGTGEKRAPSTRSVGESRCLWGSYARSP